MSLICIICFCCLLVSLWCLLLLLGIDCGYTRASLSSQRCHCIRGVLMNIRDFPPPSPPSFRGLHEGENDVLLLLFFGFRCPPYRRHQLIVTRRARGPIGLEGAVEGLKDGLRPLRACWSTRMYGVIGDGGSIDGRTCTSFDRSSSMSFELLSEYLRNGGGTPHDHSVPLRPLQSNNINPDIH